MIWLGTASPGERLANARVAALGTVTRGAHGALAVGATFGGEGVLGLLLGLGARRQPRVIGRNTRRG